MKIRFASLLLFSLLAACTLLSAAPLKLTLAEAKRIALEQNPTLAQAQANIEAAMAALDTARSAYYPSIDAKGGIGRIRDKATRPMRDFDNTTSYQAGLSASWLVFDGFARRFRTLSAEVGSQIAISDCDDARRLLLEQVAYAFYNVLQAQNSMEISLKDAEFNRQLKDDAQKKREYGTAKLSDVLNFEFQVQTSEANYISAKSAWHTACVTLGALLCIQQDSIWESIELVPPAEAAAERPVPVVSEVLASARANRPDLRAVQQQVTTAELAVKEAKSDWSPKVSATLDYGYERTHSAHFNKHYDRNITGALVASWNLFNGFGTQARIAQAQANLMVAQKALAAVEDSLESEVRQDCVLLESAMEILQKQNDLLKIAQQIRDLVYEEYLGGTATITRVNEVQTNLTNTSLARSNAWISVLNAMEKLGSAAGYDLAK